MNLTYEIVLTLGQAFKLAYQLALQAQKARPMGASATEVMETRSSKPVPKPRVGVRQSALDPPDMNPNAQSHASVSWSWTPSQIPSGASAAAAPPRNRLCCRNNRAERGLPPPPLPPTPHLHWRPRPTSARRTPSGCGPGPTARPR